MVGVNADRLIEMLPSQGMTMKPRPIRLCAACYAESPCHRVEWQLKDRDRHNVRFLIKCTNYSWIKTLERDTDISQDDVMNESVPSHLKEVANIETQKAEELINIEAVIAERNKKFPIGSYVYYKDSRFKGFRNLESKTLAQGG